MTSKKIFEESDGVCAVTGISEDDNVKLFIDVAVLSREEQITPLRIRKLIEKHIPEQMIDKGVINDIAEMLEENDKVENRRIVKGTHPVRGRNGKIVFLKRKLSRLPTIEVADVESTVSIHELRLFENIRNGDLIARVYPPHAGEPGRDIYGKEIPAAMGDPAPVKLDQETLIRESNKEDSRNYDVIRALVDGYLEQQGDDLAIREIFTVPGNLDTKFGNLDFVGKVEVCGDVLAGFQITAEKGISITGNVSRALLSSTMGEIVLGGRFFGEDRGRIVTPEAVRVRSVQDGYISCGKDLYVDEEARSSILRVKGSIQLSGGALLGGEAFCVGGMHVGSLGGEGLVHTKLYLGSSVETSEDFEKLLLRIKEHEDARTLIEAHLGPYAKNPKRIVMLSPKLRPKMEALVSKRDKIEKSLTTLTEKKEALLEKADWVEQVFVTIEKEFFQGGEVSVGEQIYTVTEKKNGPFTLCYDSKSEGFSEVEYKEIPPCFKEEQ